MSQRKIEMRSGILRFQAGDTLKQLAGRSRIAEFVERYAEMKVCFRIFGQKLHCLFQDLDSFRIGGTTQMGIAQSAICFAVIGIATESFFKNRYRFREFVARKVFFSKLHVRFGEIRLHANSLTKSIDSSVVLSDPCIGKAQIGVRLNKIRIQPNGLPIRSYGRSILSRPDVGVSYVVVCLRQIRLLLENVLKRCNGISEFSFLKEAEPSSKIRF